MSETPVNGWESWGRHVLEELKTAKQERGELRGEIQSIRQADIPDVKTEIAMLKVKSGVWGSIGALMVLAIAYGTRVIAG